jgi:hypothetical protein
VQILKKYRVGLIVIIIGLLGLTLKLVTYPRPHGGDGRLFEVSAKLVAEENDYRKYTIRVKNVYRTELVPVTVLVKYFAEIEVKYPVNVEAQLISNSKAVLKTGEYSDFEAVFPKLSDIENNNSINKKMVEVEIKAAVTDEDGNPSYVYQGGLTDIVIQKSKENNAVKQLDNQVKDIVSDLMKHPELIPHKGVLGGTMGFYSEQNIKVLNSKWVLAQFEDGHIGGWMLLEYKVLKSGSISWKVIDSFLE